MELLHGDCLHLLKWFDDDSIDSLVTDPPAGISFMGKEWDHHKGGRKEWVAWMESVMRECLRVMKPGAHGLVWALPRTSHWTATALEDAGFEIRDCVYHIFGSGFPKSLDVSKAIDKAAGAERVKIGQNPNHRNAEDVCTMLGNPHTGDGSITAPSTDAAKQWAGWGTALKPAVECWWLVRKPLSEKTVAANVLKWGTGALNIDASRVESIRPASTYSAPDITGNNYNRAVGRARREITQPENLGRFPSHLILDEEAGAMLDEQSGVSKSVSSNRGIGIGIGYHGTTKSESAVRGVNDSGGASRFFYSAKVSASERGADNKHPTVKPQKLMRYLCKLITPPGGTILDPFMGSGSTGLASKSEGFGFVGIEKEKEYFNISCKRLK